MIKRLNEIEDETKRIRAVLKQNPSNDELEILNAMSREESYRGIAAEFGLAPSSVKKYAHSIITKLGATNRSTAVIQAYRNGLLKADSLGSAFSSS